jgi:hypothetical protein
MGENRNGVYIFKNIVRMKFASIQQKTKLPFSRGNHVV